MPIFTVSRSQNRFLKNAKSTPTMTAAIATAVKHQSYLSAHFRANRHFEFSIT